MLKFKDFLLLESEKKVAEKMPFRISVTVYDKLKKIIESDDTEQISKRLIKMNEDGENCIVTFIDLGDEKDMISVSDSSKMRTEIASDDDKSLRGYIKSLDPGNRFWKKFRSEIKIGRFIKKIFPEEFKDSEVEKFVNLWKSVADDDSNFVIYRGSKIINGYRSNKYAYSDSNASPLMNSCMNDCVDFLDLYTENAELLVLEDEKQLILGRALVWNTNQGFKFMDRVYYINDSDYYKFVKYAKSNGWAYKLANNSHSAAYIKNGVEYNNKLTVELKSTISFYYDYPYMDTFQFAKGKTISTYTFDGSYYILRDTGGGYEEESGEYDVHGDLMEDPDDYVYSEEQSGYIREVDAVRVSYNSRSSGNSYSDYIEKDYLKNSKKFTYSELDRKWYKIKHCVWSDFHNQWIWRENATYIIKDWVHWDHMSDFYSANPDLKNPFLS